MLKLNKMFESDPTLKDTPTIVVAGRDYHIPPLAARQNRRIIPRMSRIGTIDFSKLDEATVDDLYEIIYWALTRAYEVDQNDFMDMNIPLHELMPAMTVITEQTGLAKLSPPGSSVGEATATKENPSTGTSSSPEHALPLDGDGTTSKTSPSSE